MYSVNCDIYKINIGKAKYMFQIFTMAMMVAVCLWLLYVIVEAHVEMTQNRTIDRRKDFLADMRICNKRYCAK